MDSHERLEEYYINELTDKYRGLVPLAVTADSVNSSFDGLNELRKTKKLPKQTKREFVRNLEEEIQARIDGIVEHSNAGEFTTLPDEPASMMAWDDEARYSARTGKLLEFEPRHPKFHRVNEFFRSHAASMPGKKEKDYGWCAYCGRPFRDYLGTREVEYNGKKRRIHNNEFDQFRDTGILRYVNRPRTEKDKSWLEKHWKPIAAIALAGLAASAYTAKRMDLNKNPEKYVKMTDSIENAKWLDGARGPILSVVKTLFPEPKDLSQKWYHEMIKELNEKNVTDPALRSYAIQLARDDSFLDKDDLARSFALAEEYDNYLLRIRDEGGNTFPLKSDAMKKMGYDLFTMKQEIERDPGIDDSILDEALPYEFWGDPCIRDGKISEYDLKRHKFVWQNYKRSLFKENWFRPEGRFLFMSSLVFRPASESDYELGVKKGDLVPIDSELSTMERIVPISLEKLKEISLTGSQIVEEAIQKYPNNSSLAESYAALNIMNLDETKKLNDYFLYLTSKGIPATQPGAHSIYVNLGIEIPKEKMVLGDKEGCYENYPRLNGKYFQELLQHPEAYFNPEKRWIYGGESWNDGITNLETLKTHGERCTPKGYLNWYDPSTLCGSGSYSPEWVESRLPRKEF